MGSSLHFINQVLEVFSRMILANIFVTARSTQKPLQLAHSILVSFFGFLTMILFFRKDLSLPAQAIAGNMLIDISADEMTNIYDETGFSSDRRVENVERRAALSKGRYTVSFLTSRSKLKEDTET